MKNWRHIFAQTKPYPHYFGLADGAMHHHIYAHLQAYDVPCIALLEREEIPPENQTWLFELRENDLFTQWYLQESRNNYWGAVLGSGQTVLELAKHLRQFLTVQDETGRLHWMRAYDPRVLRAYMTALNAQQRTALFTPELGWWAEKIGATNQILYYGMQNDQIVSMEINFNSEQSCCGSEDGQC